VEQKQPVSEAEARLHQMVDSEAVSEAEKVSEAEAEARLQRQRNQETSYQPKH
jgi:hypothetical protein